MGKYKCGDHWCSDEELEQLEKVREGKLAIVDPGVKEGIKLSEVNIKPLEERLTSLEKGITDKTELEASNKELQNELDKERNEVWIDRFFGNPNAVDKHLEECPSCKAKDEARFTSQAEKRGYALTPKEKPLEAEKPPEEPAKQPWAYDFLG